MAKPQGKKRRAASSPTDASSTKRPAATAKKQKVDEGSLGESTSAHDTKGNEIPQRLLVQLREDGTNRSWRNIADELKKVTGSTFIVNSLRARYSKIKVC